MVKKLASLEPESLRPCVRKRTLPGTKLLVPHSFWGGVIVSAESLAHQKAQRVA